jgi:uncharacterized protein (TIGR02246 family)
MIRPAGALVLLVACASPAHADATAEARAVDEAFARAAEARDVAGALALYADDARVVWPGQGDEARGRAAIEALIRRSFAAPAGLKLVLESVDAVPIGESHIVAVGRWRQTVTTAAGKSVSTRVRTTEVLVKQDGKWRYLVDHASVGVPPPPRRPRRERRSR